MYEKVLKRARRAARAGSVYLSFHANEELAADDLIYADVINCLLTGEIIGDQYDADRGEVKYELYGDSQNGDEMAVIFKLGYNDDAVIITVYRLQRFSIACSGKQTTGITGDTGKSLIILIPVIPVIPVVGIILNSHLKTAVSITDYD